MHRPICTNSYIVSYNLYMCVFDKMQLDFLLNIHNWCNCCPCLNAVFIEIGYSLKYNEKIDNYFTKLYETLSKFKHSECCK